MPIRPKVQALSGASPSILNAIRNSASQNYQDYIPYATQDAASIRTIGNIIMQNPDLRNEFLNLLVNRIGRVIVSSKLYSNPWAFVKRGYLEFGETIEEIFVNLAKPMQFDVAVAEEEVFKREIPDVRATFHVMNYKKFYKATIQNNDLRQAFLSWNGITDLIARIVDSMYTGANYDEFLTMKYLLARHLLDGHITPIALTTGGPSAPKEDVAVLRGISNTLEFMSSDYNMAGVKTFTMKADQYLFVNAKYDAQIDVEVLAAAFNMDKAEFMGRRILVDSFGNLDIPRLTELFGVDPNFVAPTPAELETLDAVPAILVDRNFLMILDNMQDFEEIRNPQGLYWNYFYHVWKTFSVSPFHNAIAFTNSAPTVTSVTVTPAAVTASPGQIVNLSATTTTTNFASKAVNWSSNNADVVVDNSGNVSIQAGATGTATITATSVFDPTKSGSATLTIGA